MMPTAEQWDRFDAMKPRHIILNGGPQNGTLINDYGGREIILKFGKYAATGNVVNEREVFEWKLKT